MLGDRSFVKLKNKCMLCMEGNDFSYSCCFGIALVGLAMFAFACLFVYLFACLFPCLRTLACLWLFVFVSLLLACLLRMDVCLLGCFLVLVCVSCFPVPAFADEVNGVAGTNLSAPAELTTVGVLA